LLYLTTPIGIEDITKEELKGFNVKVNPFGFRGKVIVDNIDINNIPEKLFYLRTIEKAGIFLGKERFYGEIDKIKDFYFSLGIENFFEKDTSFAIRCKKRAIHYIEKKVIEEKIGSFTIEWIKYKKNFAPQVDLENPDLIIRVEVNPRWIVFWVDIIGKEALHIRRYRVFHHPAPVKGNIVSALILKMNPKKKNKIFIDPMAGGGTIPIETAFFLYDISPYILRFEDFVLWKLPFFRDFNKKEIKEKILRIPDFRENRIICSDINIEYVKGSKINAKKVGVEKLIDFVSFDVKNIDRVMKKVDYVITNPPYGLRMRSKEEERGVYREFFKGVERIIGDKGKIGIISSRMDLIRKYRGDFKIKFLRKVFHGNVRIFLFILGF